MYNLFEHVLETRGVFLDISKAFDKTWHYRLIFKLKQNGISGELLQLLSDFLSNRKQRLSLMLKIHVGPILTLKFPKNLS